MYTVTFILAVPAVKPACTVSVCGFEREKLWVREGNYAIVGKMWVRKRYTVDQRGKTIG